MRILVLSDIHANEVALEAVLDHADGEWEQMWFLGDLVGYGPNPNECVARIREYEPLALSGNHDWAVLGKLDTLEFNADAGLMVSWTRDTLTPDNLSYLGELPPLYMGNAFTLAHASPRHPVWEYILDLETAFENFGHFHTAYCLVGHSHVPLVFLLDETAAEVEGYMLGDPTQLQLGEQRLILNPGSVGQPRDGDPRASYALLDTDALTWDLRRVPYDVADTQRRLKALGLPRRLAERLEFGV